MIRDPNTRFYHKNPFIKRALRERERLYQDTTDYNDFLSWLRTPDGQELYSGSVDVGDIVYWGIKKVQE